MSREALRAIESLGHSASAYRAAKERLERKYGGKRRQIAMYLEEIDHYQQIRPGIAKDLEQFADLLDLAVIKLEEAGQNQELGDGFLYTKLQRKVSQSMLARYQRWILETHAEESVKTLRTWVIQESKFQTVAFETVNGVSGTMDAAIKQPVPRYKSSRTFFGEQSNKEIQNFPCPI